MSAELRQKLDKILGALQGGQEYLPYEALNQELTFRDDLGTEEKFNEVVEAVCKYTLNTKSGRWLAKLYGGGTEASFLAEVIIAYCNQSCHTYASSPLFTVAENQIINKIKGYIGWGEEATGIFMPGGSYSSLIGIVCARYKRYPNSKTDGIHFPIQIVTSVNSHYSMEKSANMMGFGTNNVLKIDYDTTTPEQFEELVKKNNVFLINSTFGTTSEGTMESVTKFSKTIQRFGIWHHIDACVGGVALFSSKYRHLTASFKDADSITIDCHKCLNINQQCSLLLIKDKELLSDCSSVVAPYLFHKDSEHDISHKSFQCGRRADGFKLWFCDQVDDLDGQATLIYDRNMRFKQLIEDDDRLTAVNKDSLTHACFKLVTEVPVKAPVKVHEITARLRKEGTFVEYYEDYFRIVAVNENCTEERFKEAIERIYQLHLELSC